MTIPITLYNDKAYFDCEVEFTNGEKLLINHKQLQAHRELWEWEDWKCTGGSALLMVTADMEVFSCNSKNDKMGNLLDPSFAMLEEPTTCKQFRCQSKPMDLILTKFKENK